jgi:hypothetical protein
MLRRKVLLSHVVYIQLLLWYYLALAVAKACNNSRLLALLLDSDDLGRSQCRVQTVSLGTNI